MNGKKKMNKDLKLYILVRKDMSPEQQAVQAGHAVAQFVKSHPASGWTNGTLIYLHVKNSDSFVKWSTIMYLWHSASKVQPYIGYYYDNDLHGDDPTAAYYYGPEVEHLFSDLPLMRLG